MKNHLLAGLLLILSVGVAQAETILMSRAHDKFEVTLEVAKKSLADHGYVVSHIQRCDGGLKDFGFTTAPYRLLFFGKPEEVRSLTKKYPQIIPYLPLKLAVFEEGDEVLAAIFNPEELARLFKDEELKIHFTRWKSDFDSILNDIHNHESGAP